MKLDKTQWQQIISILLSALLAIAAVAGWVIQPEVPAPPVVEVLVPEQDPPVVEVYTSGDGGDMVSFGLTGSEGDFGDITMESATISGNMSAVDGTFSGDVSVAGTLTSGGVAQLVTNGGSATSVVSGTTIAHGLGTTPTVALLTPGSTGAFTYTAPYVLALDTVSITVGVADAVTLTTVYWFAGQ